MEVIDSSKDAPNNVAANNMDQVIHSAAETLKAMAHPLRLKILCTLDNNEMSVQELVEKVGTSQSNVSQHLALLRDRGTLACRKDINRVLYRIGDPRTLMLIDMMHKVFCSGVSNGHDSSV